jgi:hypothetical protein
MGIKTKVFVLIPLIAFGIIIFGMLGYIGICKNSIIPLNC